MTLPLDVSDLTSIYPNGRGIRGVSFAAKEGEILCISGLNGSGKSTLFRVLATLSRPQKGAVHIRGFDSVRERQKARQEFFPVFDESAHFRFATGSENLKLFQVLYGSEDRGRAGILCRHFNLELGLPAGEYSKGMARKLVLIQALLSGKPLLLFDEPTLGLDSASRSAFFAFARELADQGSTLVYATNRAGEASHADRVLHLSGGSLSEEPPGRGPAGRIELRIIGEDDERTEYLSGPDEIPGALARALPDGLPREIRIRQGEETDLVWSKTALDKAGRAPPFVRGMVIRAVEKYARERGYREITPDVIDEVRGGIEPR